MTTLDERSACERYDDTLTNASFETDRAILLGNLVESGLHYNGRPICRALRPLLLNAREKQRLDRITSDVARSIRIAAKAAARDAELRSELHLSEEEEACVRFENGEASEFFARLDGLIDRAGCLKFLEYNPFPSGLAYADGLAARFDATGALQSCARHFSVECQRLVPHFVECLQRRLGPPGPSGPRRVALVTPEATGASAHPGSESMESSEEVILMLAAVQDAGVPVWIGPGSALTVRGARVEADGVAIDAVLLTSWDDMYSETGTRLPVWTAIRQGMVTLLNSMCSAILHGNKCLFSMLTDPQYRKLFPADLHDVLDEHVPWTRFVADGFTTWRGAKIDLLSHVHERQRDLVLKPANGFGGTGVVIGAEATHAEWASTIEAALGSPYVVQERAMCRSSTFPVAGEQGLEWTELLHDYSPFVWDGGEVYGALSRLCDRSIMNVKVGASIVPIFTTSRKNHGALLSA